MSRSPHIGVPSILTEGLLEKSVSSKAEVGFKSSMSLHIGVTSILTDGVVEKSMLSKDDMSMPESRRLSGSFNRSTSVECSIEELASAPTAATSAGAGEGCSAELFCSGK